jgi:hypothetical protein
MPPEIPFDPIIKENKDSVLRFIKKLRSLKDDWSSEIPSEIIHGDGNFKVRKNWFHQLGTVFYLLKMDGLSEDVFQRLTVLNQEVSESKLTTAEQIAAADALIEEAIKDMEAK